jgi:hypothetical protein
MADFDLGPVAIEVAKGDVVIGAGYKHDLGSAEVKLVVKAVEVIKAIVASTENAVDDAIAAPIIGMLLAAEETVDEVEAPAEVAE